MGELSHLKASFCHLLRSSLNSLEWHVYSLEHFSGKSNDHCYKIFIFDLLIGQKVLLSLFNNLNRSRSLVKMNSTIEFLMNVEAWWQKASPKGSGSLPAPRSGHAEANFEGFFAHLLIYEDPDHKQISTCTASASHKLAKDI